MCPPLLLQSMCVPLLPVKSFRVSISIQLVSQLFKCGLVGLVVSHHQSHHLVQEGSLWLLLFYAPLVSLLSIYGVPCQR